MLRDCLLRPCSRSDAMVLPLSVARDGVAVMSVLFLTLFGKDGGEGSIVECGDRMITLSRSHTDGGDDSGATIALSLSPNEGGDGSGSTVTLSLFLSLSK